MQGKHLAVVAICLVALTACGSSDGAAPSSRLGSFDSTDHALALRIAREQQSKVTGTFVGATVFPSTGGPFDPQGQCDHGKSYLNIRLVWDADASFIHGGVPGGPPDGPRKALIITVERGTGAVCEIGATYRDVGANPGETLLYGTWPNRADG